MQSLVTSPDGTQISQTFHDWSEYCLTSVKYGCIGKDKTIIRVQHSVALNCITNSFKNQHTNFKEMFTLFNKVSCRDRN